MVSILKKVRREDFKFFTKESELIKPNDGVHIIEEGKTSGEGFIVTRVEKDYFDAVPYIKIKLIKDLPNENLCIIIVYRKFNLNNLTILN